MVVCVLTRQMSGAPLRPDRSGPVGDQGVESLGVSRFDHGAAFAAHAMPATDKRHTRWRHAAGLEESRHRRTKCLTAEETTERGISYALKSSWPASIYIEC
jgi:hypothetical protein